MIARYTHYAITFALTAFTSVLCVGQNHKTNWDTSNTSHATHSALRVGMWTLWHDHEVAVASTGHTTIKFCERCPSQPLPQTAMIYAVRSGGLLILIGERAAHTSSLSIDGGVTLKAHGEMESLSHLITIRAQDGVLALSVALPVETYVEQVVASESAPLESLESLKALAVVVRTYAMHEARGHTNYDVCDSTHCQLLHWHVQPQRRAAAHAATLATSAETLWFDGSRASAYFNKDCGGRSASPTELWPRGKAVPYLDSHTDRYCAQGGSEKWATELTRSELSTALSVHKLAATGWQHIVVERRGSSGRVVTLRVDGFQVSAEDFRIAVGESLGWNQIPSTWFEVSQQGDRFLFHGHGWGHGVGLCQKGASVMAAQGKSSAEILAQYFPGAYTADESTGHAWNQWTGPGFTLETLDSTDSLYLRDLARARAEAAERSGLNTDSQIVLRAFASTPSFRSATLAPGWIAAFTEGDWIATQPLKTLSERHLLADTLRHEFLHVLVEKNAGARSPLWLREGLVELWTATSSAEAGILTRIPTMPPDAVNVVLAHSETGLQSAQAHKDAAIHTARVIKRYGRAQVLEWLRSGIPAWVLAGPVQR